MKLFFYDDTFQYRQNMQMCFEFCINILQYDWEQHRNKNDTIPKSKRKIQKNISERRIQNKVKDFFIIVASYLVPK